MFLPSVLVNIIKTFPSLFKKSTKLTHWPSHYWERIFQKICWNSIFSHAPFRCERESSDCLRGKISACAMLQSFLRDAWKFLEYPVDFSATSPVELFATPLAEYFSTSLADFFATSLAALQSSFLSIRYSSPSTISVSSSRCLDRFLCFAGEGRRIKIHRWHKIGHNMIKCIFVLIYNYIADRTIQWQS